MDFEGLEDLTKEQILEKLARASAESRGETFIDKCRFRPQRGPYKECPFPVMNPWGFCKTHKSTAQAVVAEQQYKEALKASKPAAKAKAKPRAVEEEEDDLPKRSTETRRIKRNEYGRFVDDETGFIFDQTTKMVVAVQMKDGKLRSLTAKDKMMCKSRGWSFVEHGVVERKPISKSAVSRPATKPAARPAARPSVVSGAGAPKKKPVLTRPLSSDDEDDGEEEEEVPVEDEDVDE